MLTDFTFEDYAHWRANYARLNMRAALTHTEQDEKAKWQTLLELWLTGMEQATGCPRGSDTEFWNFVRDLDFAGPNAENLVGDQPGVEALFEKPTTQSSLKLSEHNAEEERQWCLSNIVKAMGMYITVLAINDEEVPFDLSNDNSRSVWQTLSYGDLIHDLEVGNTPEGTPWYEVRTKPRQVGSTTFWKCLACLMMMCIPRYKVCLQFPLEDDALEHCEDMLRILERMHELWPHIFWPITVKRASKGIIKLGNGAELHCRHGGGSGVKKVGMRFNMFVASEAGKYERHAPDAWKHINTAIIPAIHPGRWNVVAWEGTNDELAYELNRLAKLAQLPHSSYRFKFYGWTVIKEYVGPAINHPQTDKYGQYADFEVVDSEQSPLSEKEYAEKCGLSPEQIGFRRQKIDSLGSLELFHQEYPYSYEESLISGTVKFFPSKILIRKSPTPLKKINIWANTYTNGRPTRARELNVEYDESSDGRWWIWDEPEVADYVLAADFSDGVPGGDYTAMGMFRVVDGKQVAGAKFRGGARNEIAIVDEMVAIAYWYGWNRVRVIGELDGPGKAVRSRWIDFRHPNNYHRMLGRKSYDEYTDSMWYTQSTSSTARAAALLNMRTAIANNDLIVIDERWKWDAEDFIKHPNGKYAAAETVSRITGEKVRDDMVMMTSLAWEGLRTHPKFGKAKRRRPPERNPLLPKSIRTEAEDLRHEDLIGGLIGRIMGNGNARRP